MNRLSRRSLKKAELQVVMFTRNGVCAAKSEAFFIQE
jgi:hypothetical protein